MDAAVPVAKRRQPLWWLVLVLGMLVVRFASQPGRAARA